MRMAGKEGVELIVRDDTDELGRNIPITTYRMLDGSILDFLVKRSQITGDEYHAGARFYNDWYHSGLAASGVIDPSKDIVDNSVAVNETDRKLAAMHRYHKAIKAMCTAHGMVMQCCVLAEESLESYGRRIYRQNSPKPARLAATTALKDALFALDEHYNGKREHRMGSAHTEGYRPTEVKIGTVNIDH